jgi:hypothetical protein
MCAYCDVNWASNMDDTNSHQVMFFSWEMVISTRISRNKILLLCCQQFGIYGSFTSNKASNVAFIIFWEHWCSTNETHCYIWWQSKLHIFISTKHIKIHHHLVQEKLQKALLNRCITTWKIWLQIFWPRNFMLTSMNIFNTWWVWLNA